MTDKIKILFLSLLLAAVLMLASFVAGWSLRGNQMQPPTTDTIVETRIDTVTLVEVQVDSVIRYVNRLYPVAVHDTIVEDSIIYVELPYQHKFYSLEDTLDIWYSGVDPKIDSALVYYHHTTEIVNHFIDVYQMPLLTAEIGLGAFYHERQVFPYALAQMRYNAPKTAWSAFGAIDHQGRWGAGASVSYRFNLIN